MTEIQFIRSVPVLVGIDIAKNRHEVLIEVPGRKRRRRVTMLNTGADFDRLTHHVHTLEMNGESFRLRQRRKDKT
jgi:hypothetical protein